MDEPHAVAIESEVPLEEKPPHTLAELINRVLDRGVVVGGDVTISLAGVDLVYLGLNALLTSVSTARETLGRDVGPGRLGPGASGPGGAGGRSQGAAGGPRGHGGGPTDRRLGEGGVRQRAQGEELVSRSALTGEAPGSARQASAHHPVSLPPRPEPTDVSPEVGAPERSPRAEGEATPEDPVQAALAEVARTLPDRIDVDPEAVQRDLARLVLTLVELIRRVVEHQAIRRMDDPDLSDAQIERMGIALQRLDEKLAEIRGLFSLAESDLDVDLGPLGKLF